jgi:hypothetical protein
LAGIYVDSLAEEDRPAIFEGPVGATDVRFIRYIMLSIIGRRCQEIMILFAGDKGPGLRIYTLLIEAFDDAL